MTGSSRDLLEPHSHPEQIGRNIWLVHVERKPVDDTAPFHDGTTGLPEPTALGRAGFHRSDRESERAPSWLRLTHDSSVQAGRASGIRASPE